MLNNLFDFKSFDGPDPAYESKKLPSVSEIKSKTNPLLQKQGSFFTRIRTFFSQKPLTDKNNLTGRINKELEKTSKEIIEQLDIIKAELQKDHNQHLSNSFEYAVNPLLREYKTLKKQLAEDSKLSGAPTSTYHDFRDWIERAALWVKVSNTPGRGELTQAIIKQMIEYTHVLIDRDIKTLQDYAEHEINALIQDLENRERVRGRLTEKIAEPLALLQALKNTTHFSLDNAAQWRDELDTHRTNYFNLIFHEIGIFVEKESIDESMNKVSEFSASPLEKVTALDNEIRALLGPLEKNNALTPKEKKLCMERLITLEKQWRDDSQESYGNAHIQNIYSHLKGELAIARILLQ
jgi:hypothetical protein